MKKIDMKNRTDGASILKRPISLMIVALLLILFGLAEVATAFRHNFFGISTSSLTLFTYSAVAIGLFYVVAGLLILTMKKRAAALAIVLLIADILGRIALVATGLYPLNSSEQIFAMIVGTALAAIFAAYVWWKRRSFL
jgi:hypothetical protein